MMKIERKPKMYEMLIHMRNIDSESKLKLYKNKRVTGSSLAEKVLT